MKATVDAARYPLCRMLGTMYVAIPADDQGQATFEQRYKSIIPFLIKKSNEFIKRRMSIRQEANYDLEDVMLEVWIELKEKDSKWTPDRGKYTTFAGTLAKHLFSAMDDCSRTVHSPRNSGSRLTGYESDRESGVLTSKKSTTSNRILRSRGEITDILDAEVIGRLDPSADAEQAERRRIMLDAVVRGIKILSPYEAAVAGNLYGLWGKPPLTVDETADVLDLMPSQVRMHGRSLKNKIRAILTDSGHATANEDDD